MAEQLVASLAVETFDPAAWRDHSREAVEALIDAKLAGEQITVPPPRAEEPSAELAQALRASLDQARQRRGRPD
ncbi:hypothetical protein MOQ72_43560 [Saccharopolyspora sp. K220]|uniref:hypothetical protein n=1 Tax=Saccharopolyspora soli TaxID=2926618 RepID=UPI001F5AC789|nr:hypothetical protein [Saccharopolyspora soli]MCI2424292.1 hypothetical protein [Saccharopolyspora soli]